MFFVHDAAVATTICQFYENPDHVGWRDELTRLGLLDKVEPFAAKARSLTLNDFIKDDRWAGISKEMDQYLPSVTCNAQCSGKRGILHGHDVLRAVSITSTAPVTNVELRANDQVWFKGQTPGFTEFTIDVNPGMPTVLLYYNEINVVTDTKPESVMTANTYLPTHIYRQLKTAKQVIVPSQGKDYYLTGGMMETI